MKNSKQLRTWLVDEAERQRMSQAEMARRTNKSAATYSRILDGTTKELNQETVDAICAWAGIDQIALLEIAIGQTPSSRGSTSAPNPAGNNPRKIVGSIRYFGLDARVAELEGDVTLFKADSTRLEEETAAYLAAYIEAAERVAELEAECAQLQGAFTSRKVSACCDASVSFGPNPVCPKCDRSCSVIDVMTPQKGGKE